MKKLFTLILAVLMIATMTTTAFAADATNNGTEDTTIDVKASYSSSTSTEEVISADISWGAMEFTYHVGSTQTWNPATHSYTTTNDSGTWSASNSTVTVTNHSNVEIKAELSFAAEEAYNGITGSFGEKATLLLASAVGTAKDAAPTDTATLTLSGTLASTVTTSTKIGTITVKISKHTETN